MKLIRRHPWHRQHRQAAEELFDTPSNHSVDQTVEKLKAILQAKGVTLFALVDHSGEAEKVGLKMPSTKLLIFGNPKPARLSCKPRPAWPSTCL